MLWLYHNGGRYWDGYKKAVGRYPLTFKEYDHFASATRREQPRDELRSEVLNRFVRVADESLFVERAPGRIDSLFGYMSNHLAEDAAQLQTIFNDQEARVAAIARGARRLVH